MIILDTNVLAELTKLRPDASVMHWIAAQPPSEVFITTITQAEILCGIEQLPTGKRRPQLLAAADRMFGELFSESILPFDQAAAKIYGQIVASRKKRGSPISAFDAMIAAIARSQNSAVATRDTSGFAHCGIEVINPWAFHPRN